MDKNTFEVVERRIYQKQKELGCLKRSLLDCINSDEISSDSFESKAFAIIEKMSRLKAEIDGLEFARYFIEVR